MQRTISSEPLEAVEYYPQRNGTAVVLLRDNIEFVEGAEGENGTWQADEVQVVTDMAEADVADNFDQLWVEGETDSKPVKQRLSELEEVCDAMMAIILEEE